MKFENDSKENLKSMQESSVKFEHEFLLETSNLRSLSEILEEFNSNSIIWSALASQPIFV